MKHLQKFAENSSIHAIKYVFSTENWRVTRIFWTFAIILSFFGFCFYIYLAFIKWQVKPEIVMKSSERNSSDFPAPAITICSNLFARNNTANLFKSHGIISNREAYEFSEEECFVLTANVHWCQPTIGRNIRKICEKYKIDSVDVLDVIDKSALQVHEAFFLCRDGSCAKHLFRIFTEFGICYTTNMMSASMIFNTEVIHEDFKKIITKFNNESEPLWTPEKGYKNQQGKFPARAERGYQVFLHPFLDQVDKENICALKTFRIFIHKPNEFVTPFHESIFLNYEEYMEFKIYLQSHKTDKALITFSPDLRKCYFEGERKLKFFKTYSKALCEWECKANLTLEMCGCVKFSMPRDKDTKVCNLTELRCTLMIENLPCNCYAPCDDLKYTYKMDKTAFNRNFFANKIDNTSVISWVEFSIETDIVEEIENFVSYKLTSFISDFGGLLGLFMGCSLLSVIEVFYFLINACVSSRSKSNNINDKETKSMQWAKKVEIGVSNAVIIDLEKKIKQCDEKIEAIMKTLEEIKLAINFERNSC